MFKFSNSCNGAFFLKSQTGGEKFGGFLTEPPAGVHRPPLLPGAGGR